MTFSIWNYHSSIYPRLTPNAMLCIAVCSARDALLGTVSIHRARHTYKGYRIQEKYGYPSLIPNARLRKAICSARDALLETWHRGRKSKLGNSVIRSRAFRIGHVAIQIPPKWSIAIQSALLLFLALSRARLWIKSYSGWNIKRKHSVHK